MAQPDRRRRSSSGRVLDGIVWGAALGAASGAVLGDAIDGLGAGLGALIGAALYAPAEVITSARRGPAEPKPLWYRIVSSALLMAVFGWLLGLIYDEPLFIALTSGALIGLLGLRPGKALLGLLVGAVLGGVFQALDGQVEPALVAAAVALTYRVIAAIAYRGRELVRVMAEEVPASELRYVVPFEARSRYVGGDYVEQLAKTRGGTFRRNPPDVGILASLDSLNGPTFDPSLAHPLIREFYEHTSRFRLSILPEWRRWMKPGYELFKLVVAEPLGQAAIPSNIDEAQRGMVSTIDTITLDGNDEIDIRGWIRTFADSGKPIYVGIYTSFRHDDRGYVSVGFPIPSATERCPRRPLRPGRARRRALVDRDRRRTRSHEAGGARALCRRFGHRYLGTEHLLVALTLDTGMTAVTLAEMGVDERVVRKSIERIIGRGRSGDDAALGITPRTKRVFETAIKGAKRLGRQRCADREHLLLALARSDGGPTDHV